MNQTEPDWIAAVHRRLAEVEKVQRAINERRNALISDVLRPLDQSKNRALRRFEEQPTTDHAQAYSAALAIWAEANDRSNGLFDEYQQAHATTEQQWRLLSAVTLLRNAAATIRDNGFDPLSLLTPPTSDLTESTADAD